MAVGRQWSDRGDDDLFAGDGTDTLNGGYGNDTLAAGKGDDSLIGGTGNDLFVGWYGSDTMTGGLGSDAFKYSGVYESFAGAGIRDVITDFDGAGAGVGDVIDLSRYNRDEPMEGRLGLTTYIGSASFTAPGQLRYADGILSGNTDADAAAEFEIQLVGSPALTVGGAGTDILL